MRRGLGRDALQHGLGRGPSSETRFLPFNIQRHSFNNYKLKPYCVWEEPHACPGVGTSPGVIFLVARPRTHRLTEQSPGLPRSRCVTSGKVLPLSGLPSLSFPGPPPPLTWTLTESAPRGSCFQQLQPPPSSSWLLATYPDRPGQLRLPAPLPSPAAPRSPRPRQGVATWPSHPGQALASPGSLVTFAERPCWVLWQTGSKPRTAVRVLGKRVVGSSSQPSVSLISGRDVSMNIHGTHEYSRW